MANLLERITINPDQCGGRPCIRGMRIRVIDVLDLFAAGLTSEQILEEMPDLGLRDAEDKESFEAARQEKAVVMTKDSDFVLLLDKLGAPPQVIWVTCGNTSNVRLKEVANDYRRR